MSDTEADKMKMAFLTSLRQTIRIPATPLIETIQSMVSSVQKITATKPLENQHERIQDNQDETGLIAELVSDSKSTFNEDIIYSEEVK